MIVVEVMVALIAASFVIIVFAKKIHDSLNGKSEECDVCKKRMNKSLDKIRKELNKECECKNKA